MPWNGNKILIVDDEPDALRAVSMRLAAEGYEIVTATDGASATRAAVRERPDMIILDIGMPGGNGHTVAARLRSNLNTLHTPILFLTASTAPQDKARAARNDAVGFLSKPYKSEDLVRAVRKALPRPD